MITIYSFGRRRVIASAYGEYAIWRPGGSFGDGSLLISWSDDAFVVRNFIASGYALCHGGGLIDTRPASAYHHRPTRRCLPGILECVCSIVFLTAGPQYSHPARR